MDFLNPVENPTGFVVFTTVLTVAIIVVAFAFRAKWSAGLMTGGMKGGTPGTATILGMGQTGTLINNQPVLTFELLVELPGQQPYHASVKQTIPMMAIGMLAPGRRVGVLADPEHPQKVKVDLQTTANLGAVAGIPGVVPAAVPGMPGGVPGMAPGATPAGAPSANVTSNAELLARGVRTWVTILSVTDTGQLYGTDPIVLLGLHVHAADGEYQTNVNGYRVPADVRPKLAAGKQLQGAYDPAHRESVALDWATA